MASEARRQKRFNERQSKKMFQKISQQTLNKINSSTPEEKEQLLLLYKHMLEEREINFKEQKQKENGM